MVARLIPFRFMYRGHNLLATEFAWGHGRGIRAWGLVWNALSKDLAITGRQTADLGQH